MNRVTLRPLAKVNLGLDIVRLREDGYHEVKMVMQTLQLHDYLSMDKLPEDKITMKSNLSYLPVNENNLAVKAVKLLKDEFHIKEGVALNLKKVIPVSGGMAGGSTDAASALWGMNRLFHLNLSKQELMERGVKLGADVPYCILRGTALSEGIGEILTSLPAPPECGVLVVKPSFSVSTAKAYADYDSLTEVIHPDIDGLIEAIRAKDLDAMCAKMGNSLELVTEAKHPMITEIKNKMEECGAKKAMMSGSGPTVFGIFKTLEEAESAMPVFKKKRGISQVYATTFFPKQ